MIGLLVAIGLAGCMRPVATESGTSYVVGEPYQRTGVWAFPREQWDLDETGLAVVQQAQRGRTLSANREPIDPDAMTAAHPTLQLPALVRVTHLGNGRSVVVRVNDRGPPHPDRAIAVSSEAGRLLGLTGTQPAPVRVQLLSDDSRLVAAHARNTEATAPSRAESNDVSFTVAAAPRPLVVTDSAAGAPAPTPPRRQLAIPDGVPGTVAAGGRFLPSPIVTESPIARPPRMIVRTGFIERAVDADRLAAILSGMGPSTVRQERFGPVPGFVVRFGPFQDVERADMVAAAVRARGQANVAVVIE